MARYAIAAGDQITADAAAHALDAGGGAVDAVIAGALAACVAEPVLASLLGGGFLMIRDADGGSHLLDFFVQTPRRKVSAAEMDFRGVMADFGEARQEFHIGAAAIAAPGVAAGLAEAHARFGRVPMPDLAAPAVRAAKDGASLSPYQASVLEIVRPIFTATPGRFIRELSRRPGQRRRTLGCLFRISTAFRWAFQRAWAQLGHH